MAQAATLDNTMGAMFIGVLFAAVLYGGDWTTTNHNKIAEISSSDLLFLAACIQTCSSSSLSRFMRVLQVAAVMIVDTLHQALIAHTVYTYLITNFGNAPELLNTELIVSVFVFGVIGSDSIINKLIIFSINTGALTSLCAIASMLSILLAPATFIYISFFFCMGRLYANSLLATLNIRTLIRKEGGSNVQASGDTGSIPLGNYNTSIFNPPSTISVKIDTSREYTTDREREQKRTTDFEDLSSRMNLP
ncbi:hypothetical protein HHX47_DHR2000240 [Lentinula edodes]|nr:hypothetical protein HHX47_DHR2000240 [Lentinula edodes]